MFDWPTPLYDARVKIQEQALGLRKGSHPKNAAGALDEIGAELDKALEGLLHDTTTDEVVIKMFAGAVGFVEATSAEQMFLWQENKAKDGMQRTWDESQRGGPVIRVGVVGDHPVVIVPNITIIDGYKLIMYYACSRVVDHDLIEKWIDANAPDTARKTPGGLVNHTNAMNFGNIFPYVPKEEAVS